MGDNGRQPLSRRVPGATDMPKAQLRRQPPKLPDHVVERLRAEVSAARARAEEQPDAQGAEQAGIPPQRPGRTVGLQPPKNVEGRRFPRNLVAPEPIETGDAPEDPHGAVTAQSAADVEVPRLPKRTASPKRATGSKGLAVPQPAAAVDVPELPKQALAPQRAVTVEVPQVPERVVAPKAPRHAVPPLAAEYVAARPSPPEPWPVVDDNTEPIPVVRPAMHTASMVMDRESDGQTEILDWRTDHGVELEKADLPDGGRRPDHRNRPGVRNQPDNDSATARTSSRRLAAPTVDPDRAFGSTAARPRPRRRLSGLAAAPRSSARRHPTTLQTLFMDTGTFEEVMASARAQADGRRTGLEWRYRMVSLIVMALVVLAVLVFLATR